MDPTISQARNDNTQPSDNVAINTGTQNSFQFLKNPDATRQKIVEILASTANGCLSELGYYPGMTLRMQELEDLCAQQEKDIMRMKADQRRLLEDNYKLNTLAQTQATRLKDMGLTEIEKASRLGKLEEEVQRLTTQKRELVQGRKMQDAGGKEVELSFTELQIKHMDLLDSYRLAYAEVQRLHSQVKSQAEELNSVKMQLNTVIVQQNMPNGSNQTVKISSQPHPPGRSTNQVVHPANMQPQTIQQGQQIRQQLPQTLQRAAPHPPQQPQYNNAQRSASQPMIMPPSHPQYNQILASQLSQNHKQGAQQQRPPMLQTVSPSQLYFAQQELPGQQQQQQQPSAFYMPQAGTTAASPIVVPPEIQQRQPQLANAGQIRSQNQQQLNAAMTQQMSQNNRPQPQNYELSSFYQASSQSTSGHNQQILAQHNQQRGGIRRASFPTAVSQPSQYMPLPNGPNQVVQQPNPPQMGPPTQLPPQYNPGQSHRLNAPSEAPPWSAPPGPGMPAYGLSGIHNQAQPQIRLHSGMSSGGEPILPGDGTSRQSHSVPTTPTQGYSEPSHSVLSIRTPNSVSRPSSSSSSSPRVYLPPPPVDESTIITSSSLKNRPSGAGVGASLSRPSSSSSRPGSRQQSVALPSPLITQPQPMLSISQPVIGPNFASLHPSASNSPVPRADSHPQSAPANMLGAPIPMKRESSISVTELRQMSEEQSTKRMRVDTESRSPATEPPSQPQPMATPAVSPVAPPPVASPAAIVVKGEIMDDVPMSFNSGYGDGDVQMGNEDEVIVIEEEEVGPDGLRLVSNCLPDVYDTISNEDGSISNTCKLCQHRYSLQLLSEPPSPFINATDDDLEKHCLDDHESVWMRIRDPS